MNELNEIQGKLIVIAEVATVHGVKGQVKLRAFTETTQSLLAYLKSKKIYWNYQGSWQPMPLDSKQSLRVSNNNIIINITGCEDRDQAKQYQFTQLAISREDLPELDNNQYYWTDLEGLKVYSIYNQLDKNSIDDFASVNLESLTYLGVVDHLIETGSNDVLVIKESNLNNSREYLVPYILEDYVVYINLDKNLMIVDWDPEF